MDKEEEMLKWLKKISLQNGLLFKHIHEIERNQDDVVSRLEDFMLEFSSPQLEIHNFGFPEIWQTVTIKSCPSKEAFEKELTLQDTQIIDYAKEVISHSGFSIFLEKDLEADLVLVSVRELGFNKGTYLNSIKKRAKKAGLVTFTSGTAPLLRLYCRQQPVEKIIIAMTPAKIYEEDSDRADPVAFCLRDDGEYESLDIDGAHRHTFYEPDEYFLFVKPRNK